MCRVIRPAAATPATSLLRHDLPEGRPHFDWLVELGRNPPGGRVPTFRLRRRLDLAPAGARIAAVRIADHRPLYLGLGVVRELSRGRGRVTPRRHGRVESSVREGAEWRLSIAWAVAAGAMSAVRTWIRLRPAGGDRWLVEVTRRKAIAEAPKHPRGRSR